MVGNVICFFFWVMIIIRMLEFWPRFFRKNGRVDSVSVDIFLFILICLTKFYFFFTSYAKRKMWKNDAMRKKKEIYRSEWRSVKTSNCEKVQTSHLSLTFDETWLKIEFTSESCPLVYKSFLYRWVKPNVVKYLIRYWILYMLWYSM